MSLFRVQITCVQSHIDTVLVEANSEAEAFEKANRSDFTLHVNREEKIIADYIGSCEPLSNEDKVKYLGVNYKRG